MFDSKLEGFQSQISFFDEDNLETDASNKNKLSENKDLDSFSLVQYLQTEGYDVIDQREKGGCIWVIRDETLQPLMDNLERTNISFKYSPNGSRSTKKYLLGIQSIMVSKKRESNKE
ncbi:hypothetical protein [Neobacillus ginsengisoli]|uniref:Uncharacterized protein n=1 Tax=Neobacillus ginsengisoli TaxID=904295 RepID=A0ABT9XZT0_9BACI|nr:hypothetical protein [Neobacillus ginsengisoli]MDQ0201077.1 hypothetical protein [Neobacillus ginsengisoli]